MITFWGDLTDWLLLFRWYYDSDAGMDDSGLTNANSQTSLQDDLSMQEQASQLPCRLTKEELLYFAALRVADVASWKTESGDLFAACSLQLLAVRLLDHLLSMLVAPSPLKSDKNPCETDPAVTSPTVKTLHLGTVYRVAESAPT